MRMKMMSAVAALLLAACTQGDPLPTERAYLLERVDDAAVVQLYADGFMRLTRAERVLAWHLTQAAIVGRDIYVQQRCAEGMDIRELCEEILVHAGGVDAAELARVRRYVKLFWINNSPYNNLSARKFTLEGSAAELRAAAECAAAAGAKFPQRGGETVAGMIDRLAPMLFDPNFKPMVTVKNPERGGDIVTESAVTFYGPGVTLAATERVAERYPLNSTLLLRPDGALEEVAWRAGDAARGIPPGLYAREITRVIGHLERALPFAPPATKAALEHLIRFYRTGDAADFRAYNIAWVADAAGAVDTVNGFIEVYMDPRGQKGAWEGIVSYEDPHKARLIQALAENAKWFEANMPYEACYRRPDVKGIIARSIDVLVETGDSGPVTPIGINLPNDQSVREQYGSKSVSIANVVEAYDRAAVPGARGEFCWDAAELARAEKWGPLVADLHTNMHEVIGHASGRLSEALRGKDPATLIREHYSALEEARADLVALWFIMDPKLLELGLVTDVREAALAQYEAFTRNGGLSQLRRVRQGTQIEEDHMRNRQMIVRWVMEHSDAIKLERAGERSFLRVTSPETFRTAIGQLLRLVQHIKSEGDYAGARELFEKHGIRIDTALRDEVVRRYDALNVPTYTGFVMPRLSAVRLPDGSISDVEISYPLSLEQQMLEWSGRRNAPR